MMTPTPHLGATPKVSVALCTYNGARYLRTQLESILTQSVLPDEIIVRDDGSRDATLAIAESCLSTGGVAYSIEQNAARMGSSANFGRAFADCSGDIIIPCDQDDSWRGNKLATLKAALIDDPGLTMVFSNAAMMDEHSLPLHYTQWQSAMYGSQEQELTRRGELMSVLLRYPVVCGATMAFRRSVLPLALPIAEEWVQDEWITWLCAATSRVGAIDEILVDYRHHSAQQIGAARLTLARQLATAKRLDRAYFERQVRRFTRLRERLSQWGGPIDQRALTQLDAKIAYQEDRVRVWAAPVQGWISSTRSLLRGEHHRYGLGAKSWLFDLGHRLVPRDS